MVLCHPHPQHGGTMRSIVIGALFGALPHVGVTCLRFNFRGVERSEDAYDDGHGEQLDVAGGDRDARRRGGRRGDTAGARRLVVRWRRRAQHRRRSRRRRGSRSHPRSGLRRTSRPSRTIRARSCSRWPSTTSSGPVIGGRRPRLGRDRRWRSSRGATTSSSAVPSGSWRCDFLAASSYRRAEVVG